MPGVFILYWSGVQLAKFYRLTEHLKNIFVQTDRNLSLTKRLAEVSVQLRWILSPTARLLLSNVQIED